MTERVTNVIFWCGCAFALILYAFSLNFAPWMDEVHIVEMGRLVFGSSTDSILTNADGTFFVPLYYLGPVMHDLAFRFGGVVGVRLVPMFWLLAAAYWFRRWLIGRAPRDGRSSFVSTLLLSLIVLTLPLFMQSVRMVRLDMTVMAIGFAILSLIDRPIENGSRRWLIVAAILAMISLFVWPSAILLWPLYAAIWCERSSSARRSLAKCGADVAVALVVMVLTAVVMLIPICGKIPQLLSSFAAYFNGAGSNLVIGGAATARPLFVQVLDIVRGLVVFSVKETLRAPFVCLILPIGLVVAFRHRPWLVLALMVALAMAIVSGLHTFRNIFLFPYLLVLFVDTMLSLSNRLPRFTFGWLVVAALYGLVTGPVSYFVAAKSVIPVSSPMVMTSHPSCVFNVDYSTYYLYRQLGWCQRAYSTLSNCATDPARLLNGCDVVVLPKTDRYRAIEESHTLYGWLRDLCLAAARRAAQDNRQNFFSRIGEAFVYADFPAATREQFLQLVNQSGCVVVK